MGIKGSMAKENVIKRIAKAFGNDFLGVYDKKVYVLSEENGEKIQVALSLTCPKNQVPVANNNSNINTDAEGAFSAEVSTTTTTQENPVVITAEETERVKQLMATLGL